MKTMYPAQVNSPGTELAAAIDAVQDTFLVADGSVLPDGPNLLTIGTDEAAETILYTGKTGDELTGVTRGFQGTAQSWAAGTKVARFFTAYDHDAAIDNISELSTGLTAAKDRLDIVERQNVVLKAGLQILSAQRRAAFSLSGIKGRTLVNMLGRIGSCEDTSKIHTLGTSTTAITLSPDKTQGSNSFKVVQTTSGADGTATATAGFMYSSLSNLKTGGKYLLVADFKTETLDSLTIHAELWGTQGTRFNSAIGKTWSTQFFLLEAVEKFKDLFIWATAAGTFFVDAVRMYEVSDTEYAALDNITPEQVAAKYPYVDSVQPVRNPYAIRYGENLLPPFNEYVPALSGTSTLNTKTLYEADLITTATTQPWNAFIPVLGGGTYTLSYESSNPAIAYINLQWHDEYGAPLGYTPKNENGQTVQAPARAVRAKILVTATAAGTFNFKNPMLTLGSSPKPFKPREDSMLALQTDLFASRVLGANADEVFEKDGAYFKLAKWKKVALDGGLNWTINATKAGMKQVKIPTGFRDGVEGTNIAVKFDGKILPHADSSNMPDTQQLLSDGYYISIPSTDSGWGDNYTPTADEIKAYFMGWVMRNMSASPYNDPSGAAQKTWTPIGYVPPANWNSTWEHLRMSVPANEVSPSIKNKTISSYQLVYQLATPTVEPIVSEGMLTLNEGDNQIEVGTGIVVRESVVPQRTGDAHVINDINLPGSILNHKVEKFLNVYKNGYRDQWEYRSNLAYGNERRVKYDGYDSTAAYSVTYLMLDKSPIVPFTGSYAANEKAMLQELTDAVQENATAVSVLMNKKADKGEPDTDWIAPTLINGATQYPDTTTYNNVGYKRLTNGEIRLRGMIRTTTGGVPSFILPSGFRPRRTLIFPCSASGTTVEVRVYTGGDVVITAAVDWLSLDSITYLAEQ